MENKDFALRIIQRHTPNLQDVVETGFRYRRLMLICLGAIVLVPLIAALALPKYKGEMKFLIVRERVDPVVTPSAEKQSVSLTNPPVVSEEELNSEVELLSSRDLLRKVVIACDLAHPRPTTQSASGKVVSQNEDRTIESAVRELNSNLEVEPVRKTNIVQVTYKNRNPELAGRVLNELSRLYIEKHRDVHRLPGQFKFFEQEAERYKKGLELAEGRLVDFPRKYGVVAPALGRDMTLQKLNEFNANLQQARASIAETERRIHDLEQQALTTPARITTQVRRSDNPQLLQMMKSTLLNLELKRSELLAKYQPDYRPVQEVEKEISNTRAAIASEDRAPVKDETSDVNPVQEWIRSELSKSRADLQGLRARAAATEGIVRAYQARATQLEQKSIEQGDLLRTAKAEESNYLLYLTKREEARITEALDQTHILNVAIAEEPNVSALPAHSPVQYASASFLLMTLLSIGLVLTLHYMDSTLRSSSEVEFFLNTRVLAEVPLGPSANETNGRKLIEEKVDPCPRFSVSDQESPPC